MAGREDGGPLLAVARAVDARTFHAHVARLEPFSRRQRLPAEYVEASLGALADADGAPAELRDLIAATRRAPVAISPAAAAPRR